MSDHSADPFDTASEREDQFREDAIQRVRSLLAETDPDFDGKNCMECGLVIPVARLRLQKIRCVNCQEAIERRSKLFR